MAAITWRNVDGPSLADAARPLAYARDTFTGGLDALGNAIKGYEAGQERMFKKQDDAATQDILGQIYQAGSVADFNRLNTSGALDQAVAANGARIDRAAVNALRDGRVGVLQGREKQGWEFQDATTDRAQLPVVQEILTLASAGQKDAALAKMVENPNLRMPAQLMDSIVKGDRDFQRWGFTVAEEKQKEVMRPLDVQAKKLANAGQSTSNSLGVLNLDKARLDAADAKEVRALENAVATAQADYTSVRTAMGKEMGALASRVTTKDPKTGENVALPLTSIGHPDFDLMSKDQIAAYDAAAKQNNMPLSTNLMRGDTQAANDFLASLEGSNQFKASTLKKFKDSIRAGFNTDGNAGRVGNDAANIALTNARNKVKFDEMDANNWYAPGSANATRNWEDINSKLDGIFGADEKEDLPHVREYLNDVARNGIKVKDKNGKEVSVVPSKNDILGAVGQTYEGWNLFNTGRKDDIKKALEKAVKDQIGNKKIEDSEESQIFRRQEATKAILGAKKP
jgi:hypothetical protein